MTADAYMQVLQRPRSLTARRALLAHWQATSDPRAVLLKLQLLAHEGDPEEDRADHFSDAYSLIRRQGAKFAGPIASLVSAFDFHMGLVDQITVSALALCEDAGRYFSLAPLLSLTIDDPADAPGIERVPELAQILELQFRGRGVSDDFARALANSPMLREVRVLGLAHGQITYAGLAALQSSPNLPNLISINLTGTPAHSLGTEFDDYSHWIPERAAALWNEACESRFLRSAYTPAYMWWPPFLDSYAWTE